MSVRLRNASLLSEPRRERADRSRRISAHLRAASTAAVSYDSHEKPLSEMELCKCRQFGFVRGGDRPFVCATIYGTFESAASSRLSFECLFELRCGSGIWKTFSRRTRLRRRHAIFTAVQFFPLVTVSLWKSGRTKMYNFQDSARKV